MVSDQMSLGEIISALYKQFLAKYGDEELASIATATAINDLLEQHRLAVEQAELGHSEPDQ